MITLTVQNPRHKCDWETRMITDKKIIADYTYCNNDYYTEIIIIMLIYTYMCVLVLQLTLQSCIHSKNKIVKITNL